MKTHRYLTTVVVLATAAALPLAILPLAAQAPPGEMVEWRYVGATQGASKYSPVDDINRANIEQLEIAWTWEPNELPNQEFNTRPGSFEATPLMIDNVIYVARSGTPPGRTPRVPPPSRRRAQRYAYTSWPRR